MTKITVNWARVVMVCTLLLTLLVFSDMMQINENMLSLLELKVKKVQNIRLEKAVLIIRQ